jgi:hypothetical protein
MGISGSGGGEDGAELSHCHEGGGALESLLLQLEDKLGIASERHGPYPLLRGSVCLLNYEVTKEALKEEGGSFGKVLTKIATCLEKGFYVRIIERVFTVWKHSIPSFVTS